jgi:Skp family chaperone for outer membrane proteins
MKNFPLFSIILASAAFSFFAVTAQAAPPQGLPVPKILVIDRNAILSGSRVGADIIRQLKVFRAQEESDLKGQADNLRSQIKVFQQQAAILSAAVKAQKEHELEARQEALQAAAGKKDALIQGALYKARVDVFSAVGPILKQIMIERGANLVLDKGVIVDSSIGIDVTGEVIKRLDQKMATLKVQLVPPPPGMMPQQ